ncbi:MAG: ester cyclase [Pseudomonadota bacterium]
MAKRARALVERFYHEVWNKADAGVAYEILDPDFRFRGSLGQEKRGPEGFIVYMRSVHAALADYICIVEDLVEEDRRVAARMTFHGRHVGRFFDVEPTGRIVTWAGAAFFTTDVERIVALWVLGDVDNIRRQLGAPSNAAFDGSLKSSPPPREGRRTD